MTPKKRRNRKGKKSRDEGLSSLRLFLADPVAKQALGRLKKKDSKLTSLLEGIEASVRSGRVPGPAPSEEEEALLEQIFGKPTEEEQKELDVRCEEWLADFREVEKQFNAEWQEKTGEAPPRIKTDDDVENVIGWWKEKAALAGLDTNTILAAKDHEVFAWEPVIKGRMNLLRLQAAALAAMPGAAVQAQPEAALLPKRPKSAQRRRKSGSARVAVETGRALYNGKDLGLPTGATLVIFQLLLESFDKVVLFKALDGESKDKQASAALRNAIRHINNALKKHDVPCQVMCKRRIGYILRAK